MVEVHLTHSGIGATVYGGQHDHLPLDCNGKTIGNTSTDELRRVFHKMGIEQSHTAPRDVLCARYASLLKQIGEADAGNFIVTRFG